MDRRVADGETVRAGLRATRGRGPDRRVWLRALGALALAAPGAVRADARGEPAPAADGWPALPRLQPRLRVLANGLRVVALPDERRAGRAGAGVVAVQIWYRVGGKDDPPGRSGFAHLFEHMMFRRTRRLPDEAFDRLTEDVGGRNNAFTAEDTTAYLSLVPSGHLERILWAEAERMAWLQVDESSLRSERAVVQAEFRQRVLDDPYGPLFHGLAPAFWQAHPYRRPVIGRIEDLDAATLADVQRFHDAYYRPDNATLVVAGDFDPAQLERWVDRHFGPLQAPRGPVPRMPVVEPPREADARTVLAAAQVPAPAVALMWRGPAASHPDAVVWRVVAALLGDGDSSRMVAALVERERLAQGAGFGVDLFAEAGMLSAWAIAAGPSVVGLDPRADPRLPRLEEALLRELHQLAHGRLAPAELDKVRTRLLTEALVSRQSAEGRALAAGWAEMLQGDAAAADADLQRLAAVQAEDVRRVLRSQLLGAPRVTLQYVQQPPTGGRR